MEEWMNIRIVDRLEGSMVGWLVGWMIGWMDR